MKIVYLGTPDFAVLPLERINASSHEILAVVTQPDRPFGRKAVITPCAVKTKAIELGLKTLSYEKIRLEGVEDLKALNPDIMVTCAFGQILSKEILDIPKFGVINIHASLLPKYRGSAPIQYAIINGDKKTGVTIMQTDVGVDTGDILLQEEVEISPTETAGELFEKLSNLGANIIVSALDKIERGEITPVKQDESLASHVKILSKSDGVIDFSKPATEINNLVRGLNPWPIAYTYLGDKTLKVYRAEVCLENGEIGRVLSTDNGLVIGCGENSIKLLEVQLEGSKKMPIKDFLLGHKLNVGYKF